MEAKIQQGHFELEEATLLNVFHWHCHLLRDLYFAYRNFYLSVLNCFIHLFFYNLVLFLFKGEKLCVLFCTLIPILLFKCYFEKRNFLKPTK